MFSIIDLIIIFIILIIILSILTGLNNKQRPKYKEKKRKSEYEKIKEDKARKIRNYKREAKKVSIINSCNKEKLKEDYKPNHKKTTSQDKTVSFNSTTISPGVYKKTTYQEKIKKGAEYEEFISNIYRNKGYTVWEHGKEKGYKDLGIDIVAKKDKELILIQCKNWNENHRYKIRTKDIKALRTDGRDFIHKNKMFIGYDLKLIFTLSGEFIDNGAKRYIEEIKKDGKKVDYEIIKNYD